MRTEFKLKTLAVGLLVSSMVACTGKTSEDNTSCAGDTTCCSKDSVCNKNKEMTYTKKYTNADFYKDGKFDQEVAMKAFKDMFEFYEFHSPR
jgi:hypothetical protein